MQVKELMSHQVLTVPPDAPVSAAARLLSRGNVGCVPVAGGDGRLCGVLTDRDIVLRCVAAGKDPKQTRAAEIMTRRVRVVGPEEDVARAAGLMAREQIRRVPVVAEGKLTGLLSLGDISSEGALRAEAASCLSEISQNLHKR